MKEKVISWAFVLYVLLTCSLNILPYSKMVVPYIILGGLMLLTLIPSLDNKLVSIRNFSFILFGISLYMIIASYIFCLNTFTDSLNDGIRTLRYYIPVLWSAYFFYDTDRKQRILTISFLAILICYILYKTIIALYSDPWITRVLAESSATSGDFINQYRLLNIGGFEFSYMCGILTLCFWWAFLNEKKIRKIVWGGLVALFMYFIILTQYTTLLILTLLGMLFLLYGSLKTKLAKIIFCLFLFFVVLFGISILVYLQNIFSEFLLSVKFEQIINSILLSDVNELGSRPELMFSALDNWLESPIFGGSYQNLNAHSFFVTLLVQNGVLGLFLWLFLFLKSYSFLNFFFEENSSSVLLLKSSFLYLFLLSIFNPIGYIFELPIACFFIVPLFLFFFSKDYQL